MNKAEFLYELVKKTGLSKKEADVALKGTLDVIEEALVKGEEVAFIGFGTFKTRIANEKDAKVPGTNKVVKVPKRTVVKFSIGKTLKEKVAQAGN